MKTSFTGKKSAAFALIAMMTALVIILVVFAGVMFWVTSNSVQNSKNETFTTAEAAAEGATEDIFSHMDRDYLYGNLNSIGTYSNDVPTGWPISYTYSVSITMGS